MPLNMYPSRPVRASRATRRVITLRPGSPSTTVNVYDTSGTELAVLTTGAPNSVLRSGMIGAVNVTVGGVTRSCDLDGLTWLDSAAQIGVSTRVRDGEPLCTLENMDTTVSTPDIFAQSAGGRCVYMTNQRGTSGLVCK